MNHRPSPRARPRVDPDPSRVRRAVAGAASRGGGVTPQRSRRKDLSGPTRPCYPLADERPRPRGRHGDPAVPAHDRHQQAPAADLRPADDLLPARHPGGHGHPRGHGHRRRQERRRHRGAAGRRPALRPGPDLPLPARRAGHRPRHRPRPRLHRRRRVLRGPGRQHPARRAARGDGPARSRTGPCGRRHAALPGPGPGAVRRRGAGRGGPRGRVRGEAGGAQERPDPDRRLLPAPGRVRRHRGPGPVGPRRVRDHRRPQPLHPGRRPVRAGVRGPVGRRRHRAQPPARRRAGRAPTTRPGRLPAAASPRPRSTPR